MGKRSGLAKGQRRTLGLMGAALGHGNYYLAGGTAIGYHLGHRRSLDLDLFSLAPDASLDRARDQLLAALPTTTIISQTEVHLRLNVAGTSVDVVRYPYAPLEPPASGPEKFPVAGLKDLAAMKIAAVSNRGLRRDFWDLHEIVLSGLSLEACVQTYSDRFGAHRVNLYHLVRALTWFDEAEQEATLPAGLTDRRWRQIRDWFRATAPRLLLPSPPSGPSPSN